jgi:hypothetical protein
MIKQKAERPMNLTPNDRPWFGSSRKGEYRLFTTDSDKDENGLYESCKRQAKTSPVQSFRGYEYIGSGWEWSSFRDGNDVFKIPSGRFDEVGDPRYLFHSEINCQKLLRYVDEEFVAKTNFFNDHIRQEFIDAQKDEWIDLRIVPEPTRGALVRLISGLIVLLHQEDWLPDLDIQSNDGWIERKNWLIDHRGIPKIFDFTTYYDVFRLNESRLKKEKPERAKRLLNALAFLG